MKKINNLLLFFMLVLPFATTLFFVLVNTHCSGMNVETLTAAIDDILLHFSFPFLAEPLQQLISKIGDFNFIAPFCAYVSYMIIVVIGWLVYQMVVAIPLWCNKLIGGIYDK